jgi:hypothetical protein
MASQNLRGTAGDGHRVIEYLLRMLGVAGGDARQQAGDLSPILRLLFRFVPGTTDLWRIILVC